MPASPVARREVELIALDVVEGARGFRRQLAVDEAHVAAKVGALDGAETRLGVDDQAGGSGAPVERRRLAGGGPGFGEVDAAFEDRVLYPLPWCPRRAQRRRSDPPAGLSPSAGRSTWTFSCAVRFVTVAPSGDMRISIVVPAMRLAPRACRARELDARAPSISFEVCSVRPSSPYDHVDVPGGHAVARSRRCP